MNKFFVSAFAVAGLTVASVASQATALTYQLLVNTTTYTTAPTGVPSSTTNDSTLTDFFAPSGTNPKSFSTPTNIKFGDDNTTPGNGNPGTYATWNMVPISWEFKLDTGIAITGTAHTFLVSGYIDGTVGYDSGTGLPYANASVHYTGISDLNNGGAVVTSALDPSNSGPAYKIDTTVNGQTVSVYVDKLQQKAVPGESISHSGFIATTPEPGSVAMLVGMGVSGGVFLRRKRRA